MNIAFMRYIRLCKMRFVCVFLVTCMQANASEYVDQSEQMAYEIISLLVSMENNLEYLCQRMRSSIVSKTDRQANFAVPDNIISSNVCDRLFDLIDTMEGFINDDQYQSTLSLHKDAESILKVKTYFENLFLHMQSNYKTYQMAINSNVERFKAAVDHDRFLMQEAQEKVALYLNSACSSLLDRVRCNVVEKIGELSGGLHIEECELKIRDEYQKNICIGDSMFGLFRDEIDQILNMFEEKFHNMMLPDDTSIFDALDKKGATLLEELLSDFEIKNAQLRVIFCAQRSTFYSTFNDMCESMAAIINGVVQNRICFDTYSVNKSTSCERCKEQCDVLTEQCACLKQSIFSALENCVVRQCSFYEEQIVFVQQEMKSALQKNAVAKNTLCNNLKRHTDLVCQFCSSICGNVAQYFSTAAAESIYSKNELVRNIALFQTDIVDQMKIVSERFNFDMHEYLADCHDIICVIDTIVDNALSKMSGAFDRALFSAESDCSLVSALAIDIMDEITVQQSQTQCVVAARIKSFTDLLHEQVTNVANVQALAAQQCCNLSMIFSDLCQKILNVECALAQEVAVVGNQYNALTATTVNEIKLMEDNINSSIVQALAALGGILGGLIGQAKTLLISEGANADLLAKSGKGGKKSGGG